MVKKEYITVPELAEILGISRIAAYKKVKNGQIPAEKIGRNYAISKSDIARSLTGRMTGKNKKQIDTAVKKTMQEYGQVLKWLGKESRAT
jgi:excisionase family DNA binding protein